MVALPWLAVGKVALKLFNKRRQNGSPEAATPKKPMSASNKLRLYALIPVILMGIATLLAFLCVFAGHKPGFMEDHAVFTLNTSRVGESILQELDSKIMSVKLKRDVSNVVASPSIDFNYAPLTPMITLAPTPSISSRDNPVVGLTAAVGSAAHGAQTAASGIAHSAGSAVQSKATAIESAASSAAASALQAAQTNLVHVVNTAYHDVMNSFNLSEWHSVHIMSSCQGYYRYKNGTNVTEAVPPPSGSKLQQVVTSCQKHSAVNQLQVVMVLYWIGVVLTTVAFVADLISISVPFNRKFSLIAALSTLPALFVFFLSSAITHGIAKGAKTFINFIGSDIGVAGYSGAKFLQMTWTVVVMLLINILGFCFLWWKSGRMTPAEQSEGRRRPERTSRIAMQPIISEPMPVADTGRSGWI